MGRNASAEQVGAEREKPQECGVAKEGQTEVEGYKMAKMESTDDSTKLSSSGIE